MTIRCLLLAGGFGVSGTLGAKVGERRSDVSCSCAAGSLIPRKGTSLWSHFNFPPIPVLGDRNPDSCRRENPSPISILSHIFSFPSTLSPKSLYSRRHISCIGMLEGRGIVLSGLGLGGQKVISASVLFASV